MEAQYGGRRVQTKKKAKNQIPDSLEKGPREKNETIDTKTKVSVLRKHTEGKHRQDKSSGLGERQR